MSGAGKKTQRKLDKNKCTCCNVTQSHAKRCNTGLESCTIWQATRLHEIHVLCQGASFPVGIGLWTEHWVTKYHVETKSCSNILKKSQDSAQSSHYEGADYSQTQTHSAELVICDKTTASAKEPSNSIVYFFNVFYIFDKSQIYNLLFCLSSRRELSELGCSQKKLITKGSSSWHCRSALFPQLLTAERCWTIDIFMRSSVGRVCVNTCTLKLEISLQPVCSHPEKRCRKITPTSVRSSSWRTAPWSYQETEAMLATALSSPGSYR